MSLVSQKSLFFVILPERAREEAALEHSHP